MAITDKLLKTGGQVWYGLSKNVFNRDIFKLGLTTGKIKVYGTAGTALYHLIKNPETPVGEIGNILYNGTLTTDLETLGWQLVGGLAAIGAGYVKRDRVDPIIQKAEVRFDEGLNEADTAYKKRIVNRNLKDQEELLDKQVATQKLAARVQAQE